MTSDPVQLRNPPGAVARGHWAGNRRPEPPAPSRQPAPDSPGGGQPAAVVPPAERLSAAEAGAILLDLAPAAGDRTQAETLGGRLGGLPLALHLTGRHLSSQYTDIASFDAYRQVLDSDPRAVRLTRADPGGPAAAGWAVVLLTQELSLDALARHGLPQARPLLRLLSCYAPALPVPLGLLTAGALGPLLDAPAGPAAHPAPRETDLGQVLRGLGRLGLVSPAPLGPGEAAPILRGTAGARPALDGQEALLVHPVIVGANRACLLGPGPSDPPPLLVRQTAVTLLAATLDALTADRPPDWPVFRMLTPHLGALLAGSASALDDGHFGVLLAAAGQTAMAYGQMGSPEAGAGLVTSALGQAQRRPDDATPAVLMARQQLACLLDGQGQAAEAETIYREVLAAQLRAWPADDPGNLSLRHNLAVSVRHQGRARRAEAESAFRDLLADEQRVLGEDHPNTLATRRELALALCQEERWAEAESAFRDLLKDEQRVLGDHDPQTLSTRYNLAQAVRMQGPERAAEAEAAFRGLLGDEERALGEDHFLTVATRQSAGGRFLATSLLNAPDLCRQVAGAMLGKAAALAGRGRPEEALAAYEQVVSRFGDDPAPALRQLVAVAVFNRGTTLGQLGRTAEALAAYGQVVSRSGDDPAVRALVAEALLHKGIVLGELGRTAEAAAAYGQAASRFAGDPAPASRPLLALALFNQAVSLGRLERPEEALPAAEQAAGLYGGLAEADPGAFAASLGSARRLLAQLRNRVARALLDMGTALADQGRLQEAVAAYELLVSRFAGDPASDLQELTALALVGKGTILNELGGPAEALPALEEAAGLYGGLAEADPGAFGAKLDAVGRLLAPLRQDAAAALLDAGVSLAERGHVEEAVAAYGQLVDRFCGDPAPVLCELVAKAHFNLALDASGAGRPEQALQAAEQSVAIFDGLAASDPTAFATDWGSARRLLAHLSATVSS